MALLDLLCLLRGELGIEVGVAHLNHGLRGRESDSDQRFVRQTSQKMGLQFHSNKVDIAGLARRRKMSTETAAREARKKFLERTARRHRYDKIATGHTRSDQAETILMHLIRGGGTDGLCGIPVKSGLFIRPLLGIGRGEVLEHLACRQLSYRTDSSNLKAETFRNKVRLELLPLLAKYNPKIEESLARTAEVLSGDREALSSVVAEAAAGCVTVGKSQLSIDLHQLKGYNKGLKRNLVRWCCQRLLGPGMTPDLETTDRALGLASTGRVGQHLPLVGGLWARRGYRHLDIGPEKPIKQAPSEGSKRLNLRGCIRWNGWRIEGSIVSGDEIKDMGSSPYVAYFDLGGLSAKELRVGPPRPGLRMRLFGTGGTKKIQDILTDAKVPMSERDSWPVISIAGQPVWVAGVRRSDKAPVTGKTERILRLEAQRHGSK